MPHGTNGTSPHRVGERRPLTVFTPARGAPPAAGSPGRELAGRRNRSATTVHGATSIVVGLVTLAVGLLLLAVIAGVLGGGVRGVRVPPWVAVASALSFVASGLAFLAHGWHGVSRRRRVRRLRANHPREPWIWDHPWNAYAAFDETGIELRHGVRALAGMGVFLAPFQWVAFGGSGASPLFGVVVALFDLVLLGIAGRLVYLALRLRRYGTTELRLPRFPCLTGSEVEFKLVRTPEVAAVRALRGTLRCLQERYETRGAGRNRRREVVVYVLHEAATTGEVTAGGEAVVFRFDVPADAPGSALDERPPRYWEVEVTGETPGIDYRGTFLVPIYAPTSR